MADWRAILEGLLVLKPPRLTVEEAIILYDEADQNELLHAGLQMRRLRVPGNKVTYLVDRNVNYTNVCTINCQFCSFIDHLDIKNHTLKLSNKSVRDFLS